MAITRFGEASNPADNSTNTTTPVVITPPGSMQAGDLCFVVVRNGTTTGTIAVSQAGGQTWSQQGSQQNQTTCRVAVFSCTFNGTWSASPSFSGRSGSYSLSAVMYVFRGDYGTGTTWAVDAAISQTTFSAPGSPYTVATSSITTVANGALVVAFWVCAAANTWGSLTGSTHTFTAMGTAQYRCTSSTAGSITGAWMIDVTAGATGTASQNESAGTAGVRGMISFAQSPTNYSLTVQSAAFTLTTDNVALVEHKTLVMNSSAFTLASSTPTLVQQYTLAVQNAAHALACSNVTLSPDAPDTLLVIQNAALAFAAVPDIGAYEYEIRLFQAHTLAVQDAAHTLASDNIALFQAHTLAVQNAALVLASSTPTLVQQHTIEVQNSAFTMASSTPTLIQQYTISVNAAALAHTSENISLATEGALSVSSATFYHTADNIALFQAHTLAVQNSALGLASANVTLLPDWILVVSPAAFALASANVALAQQHTLAIANAAIALASENIGLVVAGELAVNSVALSLAATNITLAQQHTLAANGAEIALAASTPTLARTFVLSVDNTACASASASVVLFQAHTLAMGAAALALESKNVILATPQMAVLEPSSAVFVVTAHRIMMLDLTEDVLHSVDMDPREYFQNADPRTYIRPSIERAYVRDVEPRMRP